MYRDINGKTGMKGLRGASGKTYGNMKLYSSQEKAAILADGITEVVPTVKPPPTPEEALAKTKENKLRYIKEAYVYAAAMPVTVTITAGSYPYDTDEVSRTLMNHAMTNIALGWVPPADWFWKTYDNQRPVTTRDDLIAIMQGMTVQGETAWQTKDILGQMVDAATTIEAVDGVRDEVGEVTGGIFWPWVDGIDPRDPVEEEVVE